MKIYLSSKGVKPTIDNSTIINNAISKAKDKDILIFPDGQFPIHKPIVQTNKILFLEAVNYNTSIVTMANIPALIIKGDIGLHSHISNIDFINWADDSTSDGIIIQAMVKIKDVQVNGFGGNGITVTGEVGNGTNASASVFRNVLIANCKKNGIYFQGGDANQCNCYGIDVRDNGEVGIYDHSFLGNQFFGCMAHAKKRNYMADDANNRAGFFGCYSEQGSLPEFLSGAATWHGGLPANGFELSGWAKVYCDSSV